MTVEEFFIFYNNMIKVNMINKPSGVKRKKIEARINDVFTSVLHMIKMNEQTILVFIPSTTQYHTTLSNYTNSKYFS